MSDDNDIEKWSERTGQSETSLEAYSETNVALDTEIVFAIMKDVKGGLTNPEGDVLLGRKDSTTKSGYASTFGARRYDLMMETPPRVCKSAAKERRNKCEVIKATQYATPDDMALTLQWQSNRNTDKASKLAKATRGEGKAILACWNALPYEVQESRAGKQMRWHLTQLHLLTHKDKFTKKKKKK